MTFHAEHVPLTKLATFAGAADRRHSSFSGVRSHLQSGCATCSGLVDRLSGTSYAQIRPDLPPRREWVVPSRIVRTGGVRAGSKADVQLICGAGDYELDVLVREMEVSQTLDIGGQITRAGAIHEPVSQLDLFLVDASEGGVISDTITDEFGEFDFGAILDSAYGLKLGQDADAPCVLLWEGAA